MKAEFKIIIFIICLRTCDSLSKQRFWTMHLTPCVGQSPTDPAAFLPITGHFDGRTEDKKKTGFKILTGCIFVIIIRFIIIAASAFIFNMSKQLKKTYVHPHPKLTQTPQIFLEIKSLKNFETFHKEIFAKTTPRTT